MLHYPAEKRWWHLFTRCVCGLRLKRCPDNRLWLVKSKLSARHDAAQS